MSMTLRQRLTKRVKSLRKRQGDCCCWCGGTMQRTEPGRWDYETVEHLTPRSHGGTHHIRNLALAHLKCNQDRGSNEPVAHGEHRAQSVPASDAPDQVARGS